MEGEAEESDEDVQGQDKPTVLWEKCIQQSIFVDLSEDESLHLSDLESSLALHLSQAESAASDTSIHLSGKSWSHHRSFFSPFLFDVKVYLLWAIHRTIWIFLWSVITHTN